MLSKQMSSMTNVAGNSAQEHESEQSFGGTGKNIEVIHRPMKTPPFNNRKEIIIQTDNNET